MKSVSFVPKTIPAGDASQSPLDRLLVDWHRSKRNIVEEFKEVKVDIDNLLEDVK